ncbi:hypothetical protein CPB86DRAFT_799218 [Serendipita vermifera]|nr:hypothetical protein CPB86DRAFT_799218 [Serendipita vermifera]
MSGKSSGRHPKKESSFNFGRKSLAELSGVTMSTRKSIGNKQQITASTTTIRSTEATYLRGGDMVEDTFRIFKDRAPMSRKHFKNDRIADESGLSMRKRYNFLREASCATYSMQRSPFFRVDDHMVPEVLRLIHYFSPSPAYCTQPSGTNPLVCWVDKIQLAMSFESERDGCREKVVVVPNYVTHNERSDEESIFLVIKLLCEVILKAERGNWLWPRVNLDDPGQSPGLPILDHHWVTSPDHTTTFR